MTASTVKPPPRSCPNELAWAYVLNKLASGSGGGLRPDGNPNNYAAAIAIYRKVEAKYSNAQLEQLVELPEGTPTLTRAELIALDGVKWVISRGFAWSANEDRYVRLAHDSGEWRVETYTDDGVEYGRIEQDTAEWLVRDTAGGPTWAQEQA